MFDNGRPEERVSLATKNKAKPPDIKIHVARILTTHVAVLARALVLKFMGGGGGPIWPSSARSAHYPRNQLQRRGARERAPEQTMPTNISEC